MSAEVPDIKVTYVPPKPKISKQLRSVPLDRNKVGHRRVSVLKVDVNSILL